MLSTSQIVYKRGMNKLVQIDCALVDLGTYTAGTSYSEAQTLTERLNL